MGKGPGMSDSDDDYAVGVIAQTRITGATSLCFIEDRILTLDRLAAEIGGLSGVLFCCGNCGLGGCGEGR